MRKYVKYKCLCLLGVFFLTACNTSGTKAQYQDDDCIKIFHKVEDHIYNYKETKDTMCLIRALSIVDTGIKYCASYHHFLEYKLWIYHCLKRYDEAIILLNKYTDDDEIVISFQNLFGRNYYLQVFDILKYNNQGDTLNRNQTIRGLVEYMDLSFVIYGEHQYGNPINDSISRRIIQRNVSIPSVSPSNYEALIDYYTIRLLLEDRDVLLKEAEKISIDNDFKDKTLKNNLMDLIKNNDPQKFYELQLTP